MQYTLNREQFLGVLRHLVTFVGGILVARGKLDPLAVESAAGALITLVGVIWSGVSPEKAQASGPMVPPSQSGIEASLDPNQKVL